MLRFPVAVNVGTGGGLTVVVTDAWLFAVFGSGEVVETEAVFEIVVAVLTVGAVAVIVNVALPAAVRVPRRAVGTPPGVEQPPTDTVQETNVRRASKGSVTVTLSAGEPPIFC